jgi:hypothetical protein
MSGSTSSRRGVPFLLPVLAAGILLLSASPAVALDEEECYRCHSLPGFTVRTGDNLANLTIDAQFFESSVHALLNCRECHSDIAAIPHSGGTREVSCGQICHQQNLSGEFFSHEALFWEYATSVHGELPDSKITCMVCHPAESLAKTERRDLLGEARQCASCHRNNGHVRDYFNSLHYLALTLGNRRAPSCPDCHRTHRILAPDSPDSSVHGEALAGTCGSGAASPSSAGRCHGTLSPKSVTGARMGSLPLPGQSAGAIGWAFTGGYWALLLALAGRALLGLVRRR